MTFIDALNNEDTRSLIEQVEELEGATEPRLLSIRANLIAELAEAGYEYN